MKTWVRFNLLRQLKKHFFIIAFFVIFIIFLFNLLYARVFLGLNSRLDTILRILLSITFFTAIISFFFKKQLKKVISIKRKKLFFAIKFTIISLFAYFFVKYLSFFQYLFHQFFENVSIVFESLITRVFSQSGSGVKRQLITFFVFNLLLSVIALVFLAFVSFGLSFKINPIFIDFTESQKLEEQYYFEYEVSLGFLYKALP